MKNGQSRETGNKTQDEDTQSKIHNTILDTTMHKMKIKTKHNMCWTPPCTRRRQTKQQKQKNNKVNHNMCWTSLFTICKQTQIKETKHTSLVRKSKHWLAQDNVSEQHVYPRNYCFSELAL